MCDSELNPGTGRKSFFFIIKTLVRELAKFELGMYIK